MYVFWGCILVLMKILDFSQSLILPKDRREKTLIVTGGHRGFKCSEGVAPGITTQARLGTPSPAPNNGRRAFLGDPHILNFF